MNIAFDEKTIITNGKLGLLLKRMSPRQSDLPAGCTWNKMSRLQQWEAVRDGICCPDAESCPNTSRCAWTKQNGTTSTPKPAPEFTPMFSGGIDLPNGNNRGTGVIVIAGEFGAGKSTLAFQLAAACVDGPNRKNAIYVTVENDWEHIRDNYCGQNLAQLRANNKTDLPFLAQYDLGRLPAVLPIDHNATLYAGTFVLEAAAGGTALGEFRNWFLPNGHLRLHAVKMVVVDGLSALYSKYSLGRQELADLFNLFRKAGVIAVFTLEDRSAESEKMHAFVNDAKYEADTVIALRRSASHDYYLTDIEIEKSRYQEKVQGRHAYKIRQRTDDELNSIFHPLAKKVLEIFPSAHYTMTAYESYVPDPATAPQRSQTTLFGDTDKRGAFSHILPQMLTNDSYNRDTLQTKPDGQIITIAGKPGLYKSDLAVNALLAGMVEHAPKAGRTKGENGLIIHLNSGASLLRGGVRLNRTVKELYADEKAYDNGIDLWEWRPSGKPQGKPPFNTSYKYEMTAWRLEKKSKDHIKRQERNCAVWDQMCDFPFLFEIEFKRGAMLLEEMLDTIFRIVSAYNIQRVCLIDLKSVGVDYPFLIDSKTSGKMFLTSLVNWMRVYRKDLIFSATPCGLHESDTEILRAETLSDTVVTCERDGDVVISSSFDTINRHRYIVSLCDDTNLGNIRLHPVGAPYMDFPMPMFEVKRD